MRRPTTAAVVLTLLATVLVASGPVALAQPVPRLRVTAALAADALHCHGRLDRGRAPVLFLHGTTSNSRANWSWNWNRALRQQRWAHCNLDLPASGNGDIQVAAEYVVHAIRAMRQRAGRPIALVGHSQGGMIGRWALKYWPDTRAMVREYVGLSSSNHGTAIFGAQCGATYACSAANWQQRTGSAFLKALNTGPETFAGIDYTEISTDLDEVVVPSTSPYLSGPRSRVTNVAVQDLCPTETVDHFGMAYDNAAWLIGLDALTHAGPARLSRVDRSTCGQLAMPAVDTTRLAANLTMALAQTATSVAAAPPLPREPALRSYAR